MVMLSTDHAQTGQLGRRIGSVSNRRVASLASAPCIRPLDRRILTAQARPLDPDGVFGRDTATFSRAVIAQAYPELERVRTFAIEYLHDGQWKACYRGEDLGAKLAVRFEPVTARRVRLNITESTDGPTIREFKLFE